MSEPKPLGHRAANALRWGTTYGNDNSNVAALFSFLLGAVNANWTDRQIRDAVFDPVNVGGSKVREISVSGYEMGRALRYLEARIRDARATIDKNQLVLDENGARFKIAEWLEYVEAHAWKGAAGLNDHVTLRVLAKRGRDTRSATRIPISVRTLSELGGYSLGTASRSLRRVRAAGWLRLVERSDGKLLPALYALAIPKASELTGTTQYPPMTERDVPSGSLSSVDHDAWRSGALGKGPQRVFELLQKNLALAAEISSHLKVSNSVVHRHLRTLRTFGLVEQRDGRWYPTGRSLDEMVATEFAGTRVVGAGERQRATNARNRQQRGEYLDRDRRTA